MGEEEAHFGICVEDSKGEDSGVIYCDMVLVK